MLAIKVNEIKELLTTVLSDFDSLDESNFSKKFSEIVRKFKLASKMQNELNLHNSNDNSYKNEAILSLAKQISVKYDNTVTVWKQKTQAVQKELELLQNQKKLASYRR